MSEARFTKGPWDVGYGLGITGPRTSPSVYLDGDDKRIRQIPVRRGEEAVCWVLSSRPDDAMIPDANLIAAAPELYAALQTLVDHLIDVYDYDENTGDWPWSGVPIDIQNAQNALQKARGEQHEPA